MTQRPDINQLSADQLRALATELMDSLDAKDQVLGLKERELVRSNAIIEKLTHEVAILKRHKYARRSEQLNAVQGKLLDELIDSDLAAIEAELGQAMTEEQRAAIFNPVVQMTAFKRPVYCAQLPATCQG
jgi:transposase